MNRDMFIDQTMNPTWRGTSRETSSYEQTIAMSTARSFRGIPRTLPRSAVGLQPAEREAEVSSTRGRFLPSTDRPVKDRESRDSASEFYGLWTAEQPETREYERRTLDYDG